MKTFIGVCAEWKKKPLSKYLTKKEFIEEYASLNSEIYNPHNLAKYGVLDSIEMLYA